MYSKKMLRMLAKRYLSVLSDKGVDEAKAFESRMFKGDQQLLKLLIPVVHELQQQNGIKK
jgi:hypothetical protein